MSIKKFIRKVTGTEPDYWDFQIVDLADWRQYVLFDGVNPEGEQVYLQVGAIERKGRGVWFLDIDPWPNGYKGADAVLLFMDQAFDWHKSVLPAVGQRYVIIGQVHFDLIEEGGLRGGGRTTHRFLKRFKAQKGTQHILLVEVIPFTPEATELQGWYEAAKAKIDFMKVRKLPAKLIELKTQLEQLKAENAALVEENRILRARVSTLFGELNRLKAMYPGLIVDEAVTQMLHEMNLQQLEEAEEKIYGRPSPWDLILRRRRETPSAAAREELEEFKRELEQVEEELKEVEEE